MSSSGETTYTFRIPYPDMLVRARAQRVKMLVERDGAAVEVTPEGSTFALRDPSGNTVVAASAVDVDDDGNAYYDLSADDLPATLPYGAGYIETWSLVLPDGTTRQVDREAFLGRVPLEPPCGQSDVLARKPGLLSLKGNEIPTLQPLLDEAWKEIISRLVSEGEFPSHIKSQWAYRPVHQELTLAYFYEWLHSRQPSAGWDTIAKTHRDAYQSGWKSATYVVDRDEDGVVDDPTRRETSRSGIVFINGAPVFNGARPRNPRSLG